jgi:hypothetical protein
MEEKETISLNAERQRRLLRSDFEGARETLFYIKSQGRDNADNPEQVFDFFKESLIGRLRAAKEKPGYLEACRDEEAFSGYFSYSAESISVLAARIGINNPFSNEEKAFFESIGVRLLSPQEARSKVKLVLCNPSPEKPKTKSYTIDIFQIFEGLKNSQASPAYARLYESLSYILLFKISQFDCSLNTKYSGDHDLLRYDILKTVKDSFEEDGDIKAMLPTLIEAAFNEKPTDEFTITRLKNEIINRASEEIFKAIFSR